MYLQKCRILIKVSTFLTTIPMWVWSVSDKKKIRQHLKLSLFISLLCAELQRTLAVSQMSTTYLLPPLWPLPPFSAQHTASDRRHHTQRGALRRTHTQSCGLNISVWLGHEPLTLTVSVFISALIFTSLTHTLPLLPSFYLGSSLKHAHSRVDLWDSAQSVSFICTFNSPSIHQATTQ